MSFKKYKKQIVLIILIFFLLIILPLAASVGTERDPTAKAIKIIYYQNAMQTLALTFLFITLGAIIGVLMGYILGPLFLLLHKKIISFKMDYGIEERPVPKEFKGTLRSFFPTLLAINLTFIFALVPEIQILLVTDPKGSMTSTISTLLLLPLMLGVAVAIFSPVAFLIDAGIVYSNKERVKDTIKPIEVRSVGRWYLSFLKGYAGISVIFSYISFYMASLSAAPGDLGPGYVILPMLPIIVILLSIPAVVFLDMIQAHRIKYMRKIAKKIGIVDYVDVRVEVIRN